MFKRIATLISRFTICAAILGTLPSVAQAQQVTPEALAAGRELMIVMHADDMLDQMIMMMTPQISQMLERANPEKGAIIRQMIDETLLPEMRKIVPEAIDEVATVYARNFTNTELAEVIAFYKTPTGQKFIKRQSALMTELNQAGQVIGQRAAINALRNLAPKLKEQGIEVPI